jgi:vancomycin permeability regulator SanA
MPSTETAKKDGVFRLLARGSALFLAIYVVLSLFAMLRAHTYNLNTWWIDLHFLPSIVDAVLQALLALALFIFAIFSPSKFLLKLFLGLIFLLFTAFAVINSLEVYLTAASGAIRLGFPIPFSLFIALCFVLLTIAAVTKRSSDARPPVSVGARVRTVLVMLLSVILAGILFPLGQVYCFGKTEYRARVEALVVLGAHALPDGTLTYPLQDRVDKAIELYEEEIAPILIMSGGVDADGTDEAQAMKDYAIARGVPAHAIIIDNKGNSTEASALDVIQMADEFGYTRLGAVSSYYHMARIKMLFLANGHDVYTFPATPIKESGNLAFNTVREIPGWWYYWFGAVFF